MAARLATNSKALRELPSIESLAQRAEGVPKRLAIAAARVEVHELRRQLLAGESVDLSDAALDRGVARRASELSRSSLRPVINASGVILHTNLGRAPLAAEAAQAAALVAGSYTNLEYDLSGGERGSRQAHLEPALRELSGAQAGLAVNNNAAAVLLTLASLRSGEVIVSRGQLIEIGGSFRMPEILRESGLTLVEVGTTNRTHLADYERAITPSTAALLRVHQSNFRTVGFTEEVPLAELCRLGRERQVPVIDDLGSGAPEPIADEPTLPGSVAAGATLVCCSADKLLGGPQAGLIVGVAEAVARCRDHPLARAFRLDKMQVAALAATLRLLRLHGPPAIPAMAMLGASRERLERRARRLAGMIGRQANVIEDAARPGGGALPELELRGPLCAIDPAPLSANALVAALRAGDPPVIARIGRDRVLLDPRTIDDADLELVGEMTARALGAA